MQMKVDRWHPYSMEGVTDYYALPNQGVPGDWVTGSRMLDVVLLPLIFAALFPLLRVALKRTVFQPAGQAVFAALQHAGDAAAANAKKADDGNAGASPTRTITTRAAAAAAAAAKGSSSSGGGGASTHKKGSGPPRWTPQQLEDKLVKWNESCWKMTVYLIFSLAAFLVACREPYLLDPTRYWDGATQFPINHPVPFKVTLFYLLEIGFYLQAVPFLMFVEVRRKDWLESFVHHLVTLGLMYYSWYANFTRAGTITMLLHDVSDILLEAAKLSRYAERDSLALYIFVAFALSWVVLRCVLFPVVVVHTLTDPVVYVAIPYRINPQPHYSWFGTMFMVLLALHVYWTYLIFRVIARQLRTGATDDVREDEDSD